MTIAVEQLKDYIGGQRWFGDKGRAIEHIAVLDDAVVDDGPPALVEALVAITFAGNERRIYHLPLLVDEDGRARDAFEDVGRLRLIGELMAHGHVVKGRNGTFYFGGAGLDPLSPPGGDSIRSVGAEQSNTSAVLDEDVIVKMFRRVEAGPNPDLELNRLLTNEGFIHIPAQVGEISYETEDENGEEVEIDLAIAQRFVTGAVDGWTYMLRRVHSLFDEIHPADAHEDVRLLTEERSSAAFERLQSLGDVTAALHVMLSREEMEADLAPEPIHGSDLREWASGAHHLLDELRRHSADGVLDTHATAIEERIESFANLGSDPGLKIRIHGDYHLGQVLLAKRQWQIIDFEGEPARPLSERRSKQSALKDVAGMLGSLSYAARVPVMERAAGDEAEAARLLVWAEAWEALARERFLESYLKTSHEGRYLPHDRELVGEMLAFFELDKALYEVGYERGHRPQWVSIPLDGIVGMLERGEDR